MGNDFGKAFKVKGKIGGRWNKIFIGIFGSTLKLDIMADIM